MRSPRQQVIGESRFKGCCQIIRERHFGLQIVESGSESKEERLTDSGS
jgi:hypothetical protein